MDFLLECIGFPPGQDESELVARVLAEGESVPLRGAPEDHRRLALGGGLELRLDREPGQDFWTLLPHCEVPYRLRVAVESVRSVPDSPFDALLAGWAAPPLPADRFERDGGPGAYPLTCWLTDARRLPRRIRRGHVLAVSIAGFALDVTYVGPNSGVADAAYLALPHGFSVKPLEDPRSPGGCADVSARIKEILYLRNALTQRPVELLVTDAPERPMLLFVSPWQLGEDGLPAPRPGWRVEGTFLFSGRLAGGIGSPKRRAPAFG